MFYLARFDINNILERLGKLENTGSIRKALVGANMSEDGIDLILAALNDM